MTYKERVARGLCAWCGNKAMPNRVNCSDCVEEQRMKTARKKEQGLCKECTAPAEKGFTRCPLHRTKQNTINQNKRKQGLCFRCDQPAVADTSLCEVHTAKRKEYKQRRTERGICQDCTQMAAEGHKLCTPCLNKNKEKNRVLKKEVLQAYGGFRCSCPGGCTETHIRFLTIDHIHNDGAKHRREIGSVNIYTWLKNNNYPPGFRVLCMNCNWARRTGPCPHEDPDAL